MPSGKPPVVPPIRMLVDVCAKEVGHATLTNGLAVHGHYHFKYLNWVWVNENQMHCRRWGPEPIAMIRCRRRPEAPAQDSYRVMGNYRAPPGKGAWFANSILASCVTVTGVLYPNFTPERQEPYIAPAQKGEPCDWP